MENISKIVIRLLRDKQLSGLEQSMVDELRFVVPSKLKGRDFAEREIRSAIEKAKKLGIVSKVIGEIVFF